MRSLKRFRLITFDVTNTLLQFRTTKGKQYGDIGALFGVRCDDSKLVKNFKANWYKMNQAYPNFGREIKPQMEWQQWWRILIADTFEDSGAAIPAEKLNDFSNHLIELYQTTMCWEPCNGSVDLLKQIRKTEPQIKLGVIANFDPRLNVLLKNTKMDQYLDFAINSYEVKAEKPSKVIFERALIESKLPNIKPQECLHIGDGPTTDYLAAKQAGWNALLVHEKSVRYLAEKYGDDIQRNHVFPSFYDFQKKLNSDSVVW
ncbi:rhythmically expressed gene 2 protein [Scaptodrosophila lebanonensis]|uniref:Rhythmically expressed gene 2 protein n=1 Tax=Drosophila lebanonensis TaxID=7225 RepID=A0A6J2UBB9_DROLE|nr:rhythmically expressed gene 2 protein [Scaptodrosophila lebanonensis]